MQSATRKRRSRRRLLTGSDITPLTYARVQAIIAVLLLGAGIVLRLRLYAVNRSLWLDEANLALNIIHRSFAGLLKPLDFDQGAPLAFLLVEKVVTTIFGIGEYSFRLVPLMAGLASVPLMYAVARTYCSGWTPTIAVGLLSITESAIYYSSEAKQYSTDLFITVAMLWLAKQHVLTGHKSNAAPSALAVAGALAVWMSHPAIFVLGGIGIALAISQRRSTDIKAWSRLTAIGLVWIASFVALYLLSLRSLSENQYLLTYWENGFPPSASSQSVAWLGRRGLALLSYPLGLPGNALTAILCFMGALSMIAANSSVGAMVLSPLSLVLTASVLHKYPLEGRLMMFSIPLFVLLVAEGIDSCRERISRLNETAGAVSAALAIAYLSFGNLKDAYWTLRQPSMGEHLRPAFSFLRTNRRPDDDVYVYYGAERAFLYYRELYGLTRDDFRSGVAARTEPAQYLAEIDAYRGRPRVWFVFSHNCTWCAVDEQNYFLRYLDSVGVQKAAFAEGSSVFLYDLSGHAERRVQARTAHAVND